MAAGAVVALIERRQRQRFKLCLCLGSAVAEQREMLAIGHSDDRAMGYQHLVLSNLAYEPAETLAGTDSSMAYAKLGGMVAVWLGSD